MARRLDGRADSDAVSAATRRLADRGDIARRGTVSFLPGHAPAAAPAALAQFAPIAKLIADGGCWPPRVREIADRVGLALPALNEVLKRASRHGWTYPVAANR